MFRNNRNILWLWPACLVLISCVYAFPRGYGDKQVNLKIGFDLTQEVNGEPALRIRDFQDSPENYPRAVDTSADREKTLKHIRADSFSTSNEDSIVKDTLVKEKKTKREREPTSSREASRQSNEESDSYERKAKSTQGIRSGDYDPDDTPRIHERDVDVDNDSDGNGT